MKRIIYITSLFILPLLAGTLFSACNSCSKEKEGHSSLTEFESRLTNEDSVAVIDLVNQFYQLVEAEDFTSAAAMLYQPDHEDPYGEPRTLTNEEMDEVKLMLKSFPIYDHRIDYVKFNKSYQNEVKTTAVIRPKSADLPEATTSFYFNPVNYLGRWVLCTISTNQGDRTVVKSEQKDSLSDLYKEEEKSLKDAASAQ